MTRQPVSVLIFTVIVILGIYDLAAVYFFPKAPSISQFFQEAQSRAPFFIIVCAVVFGHLAFPTVKRKDGE